MKVLHFCNLIPNKTGAYESLLAAIGREFRAHGDELVMAFAGGPIPPVAEALREQGVKWRIIDGWSDGHGSEHPWRFCSPALQLLRKERPDVATVHFGNELPSILVSLLASRGPKRVRWIWEQDQQISAPSALTERLSRIRLLGQVFDRVVAVYDGGRESLLRRNVPAGRVEVIYNAVADHEPARKRGWLREELELGENDVIAVSTGWLVPRKRIDFILRAHSRTLLGARRTVRLVVLGGGPLRSALETEAVELGVSKQTCFFGQRNDVREILAEADVLVHSAAGEGSTYAITESMCAGIPAVVTEAGAAREQIADGESGFVLGRDDCAGFAERLLTLVNDSELRLRLGAAARERWRRFYRIEDAAKKYHALYRAVAAGE
jgi:L-malate glycosyltransferase